MQAFCAAVVLLLFPYFHLICSKSSPCPPFDITNPCTCVENAQNVTTFNCTIKLGQHFDLQDVMVKTMDFLKNDFLKTYDIFYSSSWPNKTFDRIGFENIKFRKFQVVNTILENVFLYYPPDESLLAVEELDFSGNQLKNYRPKQVGHFKNDLGLFMSIRKCKNARMLNLSHNNFKMVHVNGFLDITIKDERELHPLKLETIDFSHNQITNLYEGTFGGLLKDVKYLSLAHNGMIDMEDNLFISRFKPEVQMTLDLSYNKLNKLKVGSFSKSNREILVNLSKNEFTCLDDEFVDSFGSDLNRIKLNFTENSVKCFCETFSPEKEKLLKNHIFGIVCDNCKGVWNNQEHDKFCHIKGDHLKKSVDNLIAFMNNLGIINKNHEIHFKNVLD